MLPNSQEGLFIEAFFMYEELPESTGAMAYFKHSKELMDRHTHKNPFDKDTPVIDYQELTIDDSLYLGLPRACYQIPSNDNRCKGAPVPFDNCTFKPRNKEQKRVVKESIRLLRKGESFIMNAMTGAGKTAMSMPIIAKLKVKTLILVYKEDLKDNFITDCKRILGLQDDEIGIIQANKCEYKDNKVVIAMMNSYLKGPARYPLDAFNGYGLTIIDEVDKVGSETFRKCMWWDSSLLRLGMTATSKRKDGRGVIFKNNIGEVKITSTLNQQVPKIIRMQSKVELPRKLVQVEVDGKIKYEKKSIPHKAGQTIHIAKILAANEYRNSIIVNFIVQAYKKGRHILLLSDLKEKHLERLHNLLITEGVPCEDIMYYVGASSKDTRDSASNVPILLGTFKYADRGTNIPSLDTLILATPRSDVNQIVGRIRREHESKKPPVVLDILDDDSPVFKSYANSRYKWYKSIGCEVLDR